MFGDEPAGLHKVARPAPDTLSLASVGRRKFNNLLDRGFFIGVIFARRTGVRLSKIINILLIIRLMEKALDLFYNLFLFLVYL